MGPVPKTAWIYKFVPFIGFYGLDDSLVWFGMLLIFFEGVSCLTIYWILWGCKDDKNTVGVA